MLSNWSSDRSMSESAPWISSSVRLPLEAPILARVFTAESSSSGGVFCAATAALAAADLAAREGALAPAGLLGAASDFSGAALAAAGFAVLAFSAAGFAAGCFFGAAGFAAGAGLAAGVLFAAGAVLPAGAGFLTAAVLPAGVLAADAVVFG